MGRFDYTYEDLVNAIKRIGITKGDNIFIHSNIGFFGRMENATSVDTLCGSYITALKETLTEEGTFVLPTFSYSFCHGEVFNPVKTKSDCGILTMYSLHQRDIIRSLDPNFSVVSWGKHAVFYTKNPAHESFGKDSFWERLLSTGGKIVCMNFDCGSTFVHYVERCASVSYRYNKAFNGKFEFDDGTSFRDYAVHYVHDGGTDEPYFGRLDKKCRQAGICKITNLGKGTMLSMDIKEYFDLIMQTLQVEPRFLTVGGDKA